MRTREIKKLHPLRRLHLFRDVTTNEFDRVRGLCFEVFFDDGEAILEEGSKSADLFVLTKGRVRVEKTDDDGDVRELATLQAETIFGEVGLVLQTPRTATVYAQGPVEAVLVDGERFDELRRHGHLAVYKMAYNVLEMMAERQSETNRHLLELSDQLDARVEPQDDDVTALRKNLMKDWSF